jgi:hypothetical protein
VFWWFDVVEWRVRSQWDVNFVYMQRVISFVYARSHWLFCDLTDMRRKPSACFSLRMGMVPEACQCNPMGVVIIRHGSTEGEQEILKSDPFLAHPLTPSIIRTCFTIPKGWEKGNKRSS